MAVATAQTTVTDPLTRLPSSPRSSTPQPTIAASNTANDVTASSGQFPPASAHVIGASTSPRNEASRALPATSSPISTPPAPPSALRRWITKIKKRKPKAKTLLEIVVALFAIFGVVWATFVSLPSWKLQKWSAGNDFLQACLALDSPAVRSVRCNETIELGPVAPPKWKRDLLEVPASIVAEDPFMLAAAVVVTLGAVVAALIYFRPRMEPFHPVVSMAREAVCGPSLDLRMRIGSQRTFTSPTDLAKLIGFSNGGAHILQTGEHLDTPESLVDEVDSLTGAEDSYLDECEGADDQPGEAQCGQQIGLWYESDEENLPEGHLSDRAGNDYSLSRDSFERPSSAAGAAPIRPIYTVRPVLPPSASDANQYGHTFSEQTSFIPMRCAVCGDFLKSATGMQCADCRYTCHQQCCSRVATICGSNSFARIRPYHRHVRHQFAPSSNLGANWCCHCGYMLPPGRRIRKCVGCKVTCHAACVQFVPESCSISTEAADEIFDKMGKFRVIKSRRAT